MITAGHDANKVALQLAEDLRAAFYARDASRFEALLKEVEPQEVSTPARWLKPDPPKKHTEEEAA